MFSPLGTRRMLAKGMLHFGCQPFENIIIGQRIVVVVLFLVQQRYVNERHQSDGVVALPPLVVLCVRIVALRDELGCLAVVYLVFTSDNYVHFFVVDMQPDM